MESASRSTGSSIDSLISRIMANLTPNGGSDGARRAHTLYKIHYKHTYKMGKGVRYNAPLLATVDVDHLPGNYEWIRSRGGIRR